jgi:predicted transcriptional regulator
MINLVKRVARGDQRRFIGEIASLLAPWGMPISSGRVYGYLLLHERPVSLDQIAADLQMSRVTAWKAARNLADFGHVRRYGEPGSKRALYGPTDSFAEPMMKQCSLLEALGNVMQSSAAAVAKGKTAARLQQMAHFYLSLGQTMATAIRRLNSRPARLAASRRK